MQKTITKLLLLVIAFTFALSANYLFAAWVGPTQAPPGGNTPTPVHIGSTDQVKDAGLSLDALSVFGGGYFQGNVGIGVVVPTESLDVDGNIKTTEGVKIGNTTDTDAGTVRWTGTDLEVSTGTEWKSLTAESSTTIVSQDYTDCINVGGSWVDTQSTCYFPSTSCPSGWSPNESYSSSRSNSCTGNNPSLRNDEGEPCNRGPFSCSTGSHYRTNGSIESCRYWHLVANRDCAARSESCTAAQIEIGCMKDQ